MLDGLDDVEWSRLNHAYGEAVDIPHRIRTLLSKNAKARDRALHELFSTICHQGTVDSATAHAAPFLLELLAAPGFADKEAIFYLLSCIAEVRSYTKGHAPLFDPMGAADPEQQRGRASAIEQELEWVRAAREAVEAGVGTFLADRAPRRAIAPGADRAAPGSWPQGARRDPRRPSSGRDRRPRPRSRPLPSPARRSRYSPIRQTALVFQRIRHRGRDTPLGGCRSPPADLRRSRLARSQPIEKTNEWPLPGARLHGDLPPLSVQPEIKVVLQQSGQPQ
jgi:hypothetical protein